MPKRVLKLLTIPFIEWNKLHYLIVLSPIAVVVIALAFSLAML